MSNGFLSDQFNFDPADNKETTTSYTVPAGMYAIVSATLSVSALGRFIESGLTGAIPIGAAIDSSATATSTSITLRLKAGSVLTKTESPASASDTTVTTQARRLEASSTSKAALLVDGVEVSEIDCSAFACGFDQSPTSGQNASAIVTGTAKVHWHIAEYNKQGA